MIDTIKFKIPISDAFLEELKFHGSTLQKKDGFGWIEELKILDDWVVNKWGYSIRLFCLPTPYALDHFYIEFSVPKYLFGTNAYMCSPNDLPTVINNLYSQILGRFTSFPNPKTWELQRLDMCYNFHFKTKEKFDKMWSYVKWLRYPRKNLLLYKTSNTALGRAFTLKFYQKYPEFKKTDYKVLKTIDSEYAEKVLNMSKYIIRFEVELRRSELLRLFKAKNITYQNILSYTLYFKTLLYHLGRYYIDRSPVPSRYQDRIFNNVFQVPSDLLVYESSHAVGDSSGYSNTA